MTDTDVNRRLERIESKLDSVSDAIVQLARVEERQTQHTEWAHAQGIRLDRLVDRVDTLERRAGKNTLVLGWAERGFWVALAAAMTWLARKVGI